MEANQIVEANEMIKIIVYGEPVAQGRAKISTIGGFARAYDPKKSRDYKHEVRSCAVEQYKQRPIENAVNLAVKVYRSIPASWSKKKTAQAEAGLIRPTSKPDLKNYIAGVEDALNGVLWRDDSQVVSFDGSGKWYAPDGRPRIEVYVEVV
mgnify:CR=1 FL=1